MKGKNVNFVVKETLFIVRDHQGRYLGEFEDKREAVKMAPEDGFIEKARRRIVWSGIKNFHYGRV